MESFCDENRSNTATRKRPAEAPEVLVLLGFLVQNLQWIGRNTPNFEIKKPAIADRFVNL